jgi:hypothetical protein
LLKNLILVWFGVILTFVSTILTFATSPTPLPLADKLWLVGMCIVVVLVLVATYRGHPRNLARAPGPAVRLLALLVMVVSGGTWAWLLVRTALAEDAEVWVIRIQRTLTLFLFAGAYHLFTQKPRN